MEVDLSSNRIEAFIPGTFAWLPILRTLKLVEEWILELWLINFIN